MLLRDHADASRMANRSLCLFSSLGVITLLPHSHFAFWHKPTSRPIIFFRYCMGLLYLIAYIDANNASADLEMTVNMLIQIDKLVQLLESPVFTCKSLLLKFVGSSI
jgi:hypothetical protein